MSRATRAAGLLTVTVGTVAAISVAAPAAGAQTLTASATGKIAVTMRGNGHGHGLSQYGARGAAIAGKSYRQILAFYYPSTKLTRVPTHRIRVKISTAAATVVSVAAASTLTVTGVPGPLPTAGVNRYRIALGTGTGLWLQQLRSAKGSVWTTIKTGLPDGAQFHRTNWGPMRLFAHDRTSTDYYGFLAAVRNKPSGRAGGLTTVDRVSYDNYAAGVTPREMPASWPQAAVRAQAVAARTYGVYAVQHPQSQAYDICDTTMCQVYGGHAHYDAAGRLLWSDDPSAATATSYQVLEYKDAPIFSQFSASNGGWTVSGGQPYLTARADPYDATTSGDPYIDYSKIVSVNSLASYFGLAKVTKIAITARDGNGTWGGRVVAGYVQGVDRAGKAKTVSATGFDFADAFGIGTTWFACKVLT